MTPLDLQEALKFDRDNDDAIFSCLSLVSKYVLEHGPTDKHALEAIIRLRELAEVDRIRQSEIGNIIFSLCREAGLFPYLEESRLDWRDSLAFECFRGPSELDYVFHREQWQAFQLLINGKSLILSAPTSFGKSVLIHAFIAEKKPDCVVIVVPTIALLDQFRRRLTQYFESNYQIITRNDQQGEEKQKRIYVLTQERLLDRTDISKIDLLAIDEYYKLDNERESKNNSRSAILNAALRKYLFLASQIFFLGPTVAKVVMRDDVRDRFSEFPSQTNTVAVDIKEYKKSPEPYKTLGALLQEYRRDKSLVYSKSPPAALHLVNYLIDKYPLPVTSEIVRLSELLGEYYHPQWSLVSALRKGYGVHHGSIPRSVAQALVRYFNEESLNSLICTSTLIEGVNTAAKNVFVFDKKISNKNYDYFDYRNIIGRSGRMGHHFVGRVFLFHEPPKGTEFEIKVPALGPDHEMPDDVLANSPDDALTRELLSRKQAIFDRSSIPAELLKRFVGYGLANVENVSNKIAALLEAGDRGLLWSGYVRYPELLKVFSLVWNDLLFNKKHLSAKEAAFYANRLCGTQLIRSYFDGLVDGKQENAQREIIERGFRALGLFDYTLPKLLLDLESLVNFHCSQKGIELVDYSFMAQRLDNFCSHHWVKALDEYGVPIPLGKKIEFIVRDEKTLEAAVRSVRNYCNSPAGRDRLLPIEIQLVNEALR